MLHSCPPGDSQFFAADQTRLGFIVASGVLGSFKYTITPNGGSPVTRHGSNGVPIIRSWCSDPVEAFASLSVHNNTVGTIPLTSLEVTGDPCDRFIQVEEECLPCDLMGQCQQVKTAFGPSWTNILPARQNRRVLIFNFLIDASHWSNVKGGISLPMPALGLEGIETMVLHRYDFGPLLYEPVWIFTQTQRMVTVSEVYDPSV